MAIDKDILGELFESPAKVRALKIFLRNPDNEFTLDEGARRLGLVKAEFAKEVKVLCGIDLVREKTVRSETKSGSRPGTKKEKAYHVNKQFVFYPELRILVLKSPASWHKKGEQLAKMGKIKLAVICGSLMNDETARIDFLLVGHKVNTRSVAAFMRNLEAESGKELRYMIISPEEFVYRFDMFDNFLREIFERPHLNMINRMKATIQED
jgi:hypothetical protein